MPVVMSFKDIVIRFRVSFLTMFDCLGLPTEYGLCFSGMSYGGDC